MYSGFEPVFNENSRILILGSFPSVKSRDAGFFYGNPKNRFWKVVSSIFNEKISGDIEDKKCFLLKHKIALWDVVYKCEIKGSLDSNLKCLEVSDLKRILNAAKIERIFCNGTKSHQIFCKNFQDLKQICVYLPSTSPANFKFDFELWNRELSKYK